MRIKALPKGVIVVTVGARQQRHPIGMAHALALLTTTAVLLQEAACASG
jgi:hypothetical protein